MNILLMSVIGGHLKYWKWGSFMIVCNQPTYWKTGSLTKELSIRCPPWSSCAHIKVSPPTRIDVGDWRIAKIKLETYLEGVCVTWGSVYFGEMMVIKLSRRPLTAWSEGTFSKVIPECQPSLAQVFVRRPGLAIPLYVVLKPTSFPETDHGIPLGGNDGDFTTHSGTFSEIGCLCNWFVAGFPVSSVQKTCAARSWCPDPGRILFHERERILYLYTATSKQVLRRGGWDT